MFSKPARKFQSLKFAIFAPFGESASHEPTFEQPAATIILAAPSIEDRMIDSIPRPNGQPRGDAGIDLEHRQRLSGGGNGNERVRHRFLRDVENDTVRSDEDHVQRQVSVLHPHRYDSRRLEIEQHAGVRRKRAATLKPLRPPSPRIGDFDGEWEPPAGRFDGQSRDGKRARLGGCSTLQRDLDSENRRARARQHSDE